MNYTNEYSKLPEQIMERHFYKDVDNSVANDINQIKQLQMQCEYDKVIEILSNRPDLRRYVFGAENMNAIDEEIRNLEIFSKVKKQQIFFENEEPEFAVDQDVWIGD